MTYIAAAWAAVRPFLWIIVAVAALIILAVLLSRCGADKRAQDAVRLDQAETGMEAANRVLHAERAATANATARDDAFYNAQQELHHEASKGTDDGTGAGVRSVIDRMRQQQDAGRRGDAPR